MAQQTATLAAVKQRMARTEEHIQSILEEYEKSGYSVKDFCEDSDLNEATFYSWLKKYKSKEELPGFATIEVVPSVIKDASPQLVAEKGNSKLYEAVSAAYLKSLLS